jgi:hypothetical protein
LLESANKLFGEKSARFKEVSEALPKSAGISVSKNCSTIPGSRVRTVSGLLRDELTLASVSCTPVEDVP